MKTQHILTKEKTKTGFQFLFSKWVTKYVDSMTKALYPDTDTPNVKNDQNRIFYK
ncbi:hypothetical protein [Aquimarina litoralis]|uniref:hypothetical protein n=1 Tax=Aquimarina litoralis TaxID=584605 RepID=UPI001C55D4DE|nr:hypothetical protein [Aquimarina litoralis]